MHAAGTTRGEGIGFWTILRSAVLLGRWASRGSRWTGSIAVKKSNAEVRWTAKMLRSLTQRLGLLVLERPDPAPPRNNRIEKSNASRESETQKYGFRFGNYEREITGNKTTSCPNVAITIGVRPPTSPPYRTKPISSTCMRTNCRSRRTNSESR